MLYCCLSLSLPIVFYLSLSLNHHFHHFLFDSRAHSKHITSSLSNSTTISYWNLYANRTHDEAPLARDKAHQEMNNS
uniref:Uncharacterized protein n=1 Tax=Octopus bimaculoides TaxID=37653 RepID=A0A0L8HLA1_OCTBM